MLGLDTCETPGNSSLGGIDTICDGRVACFGCSDGSRYLIGGGGRFGGGVSPAFGEEDLELVAVAFE